MQDYQERPSNKVYQGVFLIRDERQLTPEILRKIRDVGNSGLVQEGLDPLIISFERLIKGTQSVLVLFGPKQILNQFSELSLLELEDFSAGVSVNSLQC